MSRTDITSPSPTTLGAVKLVGGGFALAHADGETWMVRGALPGETVAAVAKRRRARIVEAEVLELVADPHPARLEDPCPHAASCGGCDWPHVDAAAGALLKAEVAAEAASRHPALAERLREASVTPSPPAYRLRSRLHWDPRSQRLGFYAHRSREVTEIPHCRIVTRRLADRLADLVAALTRSCPAPVDLEWLEGDSAAVAALRPRAGGPRSVAAGWLPAPGWVRGLAGCHRLGTPSVILDGWGRDSIVVDLPIPLEVPVGTFFQGNRHLVPWLFRRVSELVGPGSAPVVDLHGGVGFLAAAARAAGHHELTVVEPHPPAAAAASSNLPGARVIKSTAETFLAKQSDLPDDVVVVTDPPRSGMTRSLVAGLARWRPRRLVMLGCDPSTWSRDAASLLGHGWRLEHLELVDLFPFTHHVEVLATLELP